MKNRLGDDYAKTFKVRREDKEVRIEIKLGEFLWRNFAEKLHLASKPLGFHLEGLNIDSIYHLIPNYAKPPGELTKPFQGFKEQVKSLARD
jgi:hypothetical protein